MYIDIAKASLRCLFRQNKYLNCEKLKLRDIFVNKNRFEPGDTPKKGFEHRKVDLLKFQSYVPYKVQSAIIPK
jgi:hypothetical protein